MGRYLDEILNEAKNTHGRSTHFSNVPDYMKDGVKSAMLKNGVPPEEIEKMINSSEDEEEISFGSKDVATSRDAIFSEKFDKNKLKLIKESENIVGEYKNYLNLEFDKIVKDKDHVNDMNKYTSLEHTMMNLYNQLIETGISHNDIRRYLIENFYDISDDPKIVKKLLQLRINYNNKIISMLQKMLRTNYQILGISSEEADKLSHNLSNSNQEVSGSGIKHVKELIEKNEKKFVPRKGEIDLRSLGFGVAYHTNEDVGGLERFIKLDRLIHLLMRWDVVVIGHGSDYTDDWIKHKNGVNKGSDELHNKIMDAQKNRDKMETELHKKYEDTKYEELEDISYTRNSVINYHSLSNWNKSYILDDLKITEKEIDEYIRVAKEIQKEKDNIEKISANIKGHFKSDDSLRKKDNNLNSKAEENHKWSIQKIQTNSGTYTDMNDLVRALIKEGHKKIYVMSCNPGHFELAPDILKTKGVIIHTAQNTLSAESARLI